MQDQQTSSRAQNRASFIGRFDRAGLILSSLCLIHCILSIVLVSAFGLGSQFLLAPEIHKYGLVVALIVAAVAIGWGALNHRRAAPFVVAMTGLSFMGGALAMPHDYREVVLTVIGVTLVAIGHLLNLKGARADRSGNCPEGCTKGHLHHRH
ncbi:MAG: MerC domain-containing protein [Marinomonas sp.]